jgi:hypothetical protein
MIPFRETEDEVIQCMSTIPFHPNDLFIDVGCGNGVVLDYMSQFVNCIGIEINPIYYQEATERVGDRVQLYCMDLNAFTFQYTQRCIYYVAWTNSYVQKYDFSKMCKQGDLLFVFKHPIQSKKYTKVFITTPYNNLYLYQF